MDGAHDCAPCVHRVADCAGRGRHFSSLTGMIDNLRSVARMRSTVSAIIKHRCYTRNRRHNRTCPHDDSCSPCIQAGGGLILHTTLPLLRLHHNGVLPCSHSSSGLALILITAAAMCCFTGRLASVCHQEMQIPMQAAHTLTMAGRQPPCLQIGDSACGNAAGH